MPKLKWRLYNEEGLAWPWESYEQAEIQSQTWEGCGQWGGVIAPYFLNDEGRVMGPKELTAWVAAANEALAAQNAAANDAPKMNGSNFAVPNCHPFIGEPTESWLPNGYVKTTALEVYQNAPGQAVTLMVTNSRGQSSSGFVRIFPETLVALAERVVRNKAMFISYQAYLYWRVESDKFMPFWETYAEAAATASAVETVSPVMFLGGRLLDGTGLERWLAIGRKLVPGTDVSVMWRVDPDKRGGNITIYPSYAQAFKAIKRRSGDITPIVTVGGRYTCDDQLTEWVAKVNEALANATEVVHVTAD